MKLVKRLGKSPAVTTSLCWLVAQYLKLVSRTARWETHDLEVPMGMVQRGEPFVGAFWHGRLMFIPGLLRRYVPGADLRMLISQHRDGRMISRTIKFLGYTTISGSTSRGGAFALRALVETLQSGITIGITPDGPRGPRMRASSGVVSAASRAGVPIFAICPAATRRKLFGSWDRFVLPLPFAKLVYVIKGPFSVGPDADEAEMERVRLQIEHALNAGTAQADEICGWDPIEPATPRRAAARAQKRAGGAA